MLSKQHAEADLFFPWLAGRFPNFFELTQNREKTRNDLMLYNNLV
jgi:hypothetical protein